MFSKPRKPAPQGATPSIVGLNCTVTGDIVSQGEVHIDGRIDGDIRCSVLVIGEKGVVTGEISAETVRVLGSVTGQITAQAVELAKSARILGDITHECLAVEAGAFVEGRFNRRAEPAATSGQALLAKPDSEKSPKSADAATPLDGTAPVALLGN